MNQNPSPSPKYVGPGEAVKLYFSNLLNFRGRSTRSEYWWLCFVGLIIGLLVYAIMFVASTKFHVYAMDVKAAKKVMTVLSVITFVPSMTLTARRLHDTGHSFGWIFINIIPIIGQLWFLGLMAKASGPANKWGMPAGQQGMMGGMPGMGGYPNGMNGQMPVQPMNGMGQPYGNQPMQQGYGAQPGQNPVSSLGGAASTLGAAALGAINNISHGQNPFAGLSGGMNPDMGGMTGMGNMPGMGRVCPNCGTQIMGNDMFCQNCGTRLL